MHLTWMVVPEADKPLDESASFVLTQENSAAVGWSPDRSA